MLTDSVKAIEELSNGVAGGAVAPTTALVSQFSHLIGKLLDAVREDVARSLSALQSVPIQAAALPPEEFAGLASFLQAFQDAQQHLDGGLQDASQALQRGESPEEAIQRLQGTAQALESIPVASVPAAAPSPPEIGQSLVSVKQAMSSARNYQESRDVDALDGCLYQLVTARDRLANLLARI